MNRLKELRKQNKKTQNEIANFLKVSQSNYGKYELKEIEPNINSLIKLADYYNLTLDYLVDRAFNNEFGYLTENEKELITDFRNLKPLNQLKIIAEVKGILLVQD